MEEAILSEVVANVVEALGTQAVQEIGNLFRVKDDLKDLGDTLSNIKAVLHDAEKQQVREGVRSWLERLEDVLYDADYLFDEVSYEALRKKLQDKKVWKICLSFPKDVAFRYKVAQRIKAIKRTLSIIDADGKRFGFQLNNIEEKKSQVWTSEDRETHSYMAEANVIGRDSEKMHILKLLVGPKSTESTEAELSVIAIVGVGGIGKTTLAKLVYNDASVQQHFELKIWICVSDDFSLGSLLKKIIQCATSSSKTLGNQLEELRRELEDILNGKKYLLVLDDVWNEDAMEWKKLETLLSSGKKGSKIIITTRSETVSTITRAKELYRLKELNDDQSWNLFKSMAFARGEEPNDPSKVKIGREIASRCYGVPLVIKSIGSLLLQSPEIDWFSFCRDELLSIPNDPCRDKVLQTLELRSSPFRCETLF